MITISEKESSRMSAFFGFRRDLGHLISQIKLYTSREKMDEIALALESTLMQIVKLQKEQANVSNTRGN